MNPHATSVNRAPRLLGVFAHPDDEIFCAGGTLAQWAAAGCGTMVLCATRGEVGQIQDAQAATRHTLGTVREQELRAACMRLGVQQVTCLDYRDGALQGAEDVALARDIAAAIRAFSPHVVVTFGPDGGYGHPDHVAVSAATTRACRQLVDAGEHAPYLYYSVFPRHHRLLCRRLAGWLLQGGHSLMRSEAFAHAFRLLAEEATLLGYADDTIEIRWFPAGMSVVEQGEPDLSLYLVIAGQVEAIQESADGTRHALGRLSPGQFFGIEALAHHQPQAVSYVAAEPVTCLVLSACMPTPFDGRGTEARHGDTTQGAGPVLRYDQGYDRGEFTRIDVAAWFDRKFAALSEHRSQFALEPGLFPAVLLDEWLGSEYFALAPLTAIERSPAPRDAGVSPDRIGWQAMTAPA